MRRCFIQLFYALTNDGGIFLVLAIFFDVTPIVDIDIAWVTWQNAPVAHNGEIGTFTCDHPVGGHE
jgi:hypothetical protein